MNIDPVTVILRGEDQPFGSIPFYPRGAGLAHVDPSTPLLLLTMDGAGVSSSIPLSI